MLNGLVSWEARLTAELAHGPQIVYAQVARSLVDDERFPELSRAAAAGIFEDQAGRPTSPSASRSRSTASSG